MKRKQVTAILVTMMCLGLTACGNRSAAPAADMAPAAEAAASEYNDDDNYSVAEVEQDEASGEEGSSRVTFDENRKIVYQSDVSLETLNYAKTYNELLDLVSKYEGYIQYEHFMNDTGSYLREQETEGLGVYGQNEICVRVPSKNYFSFMEDGLTLGNVIARNQSVEDKTSEYASNQSHLDVLNKRIRYYDSQLAKLSDNLDTAIENDNTEEYEIILRNMEDMTRMKAEVEEELIPYRRSNDIIDEKSSFSTINITIMEVKEYTIPVEEDEAYSVKFVNACKETWERFTTGLGNFIIFLIKALPALIVIGIVALTAWTVYKKKIKKEKK